MQNSNSSTKSFYKSKKFWVTIFGAVLSGVVAYIQITSPAEADTWVELIVELATVFAVPIVVNRYNSEQTKIDVANIMEDKIVMYEE